jgi:hypothetical protein
LTIGDVNLKRLSELQSRVLEALAGIEPPWTLTGGAALAGFHLGHRTTRDLDLFWHGCDSIADVRREVMARLRSAGFEVSTLRTMDAFSTVNVTHGGESVVVDLVAEPVASIEPPQLTEHRGVSILVDTVHEVLVNKLCALLHRSELRDLVDIRALLDAGGDLDRAVADAPAKDGGFSALTLGWTMKSWSVADAARAAGLESRAIELEQFRDELLVLVAGRRP